MQWQCNCEEYRGSSDLKSSLSIHSGQKANFKNKSGPDGKAVRNSPPTPTLVCLSSDIRQKIKHERMSARKSLFWMLRQCDISGNSYAVRAATGTDECHLWTKPPSCLFSILTKCTGFISLLTDYWLHSYHAANLLNMCMYQYRSKSSGTSCELKGK